ATTGASAATGRSARHHRLRRARAADDARTPGRTRRVARPGHRRARRRRGAVRARHGQLPAGAAMKQDAFIARHEPEWGELEEWLRLRGSARAGARKPPGDARLDDLDFPARYRRVCQQLALAQRRGYSARVLERLEAL